MKDLITKRQTAANAAREKLKADLASAYETYDAEIASIDAEMEAAATARVDNWNGVAAAPEPAKPAPVRDLAALEPFPSIVKLRKEPT